MNGITDVNAITGTFLERTKTKRRSDYLMDVPSWEMFDAMQVTVKLSLIENFESRSKSLNYNQNDFFKMVLTDDNIWDKTTIVIPDFVLISNSVASDITGTLRPIIVELMTGTADVEIISLFNVEFFDVTMHEYIKIGIPSV